MSVLKIKDSNGNWIHILTITGNGISSIVKTGTSGLVDTYTITYTDGSTSTFEITNGETPTLDTTLTVSGEAADAKATGDRIDSLITAETYSASKTYFVGDYCTYDGDLYKCNTVIATAEAWNASHWTAITVNDLIVDMQEKLDMLVTMQEVEEEVIPEGIVQLVDPSTMSYQLVGSYYRWNLTNATRINVSNDGNYYQNPYAETSGSGVTTRSLVSAKFYDAYGNLLTLTAPNGDTYTEINLFPSAGSWFSITNHRVLKTYVRQVENNNTFTTTADIAYISGPYSYFALASDGTEKCGITYGGGVATYVPYEGSEHDPVYELNYVPSMAKYVEKYMQSQGTAASNNMFNFFYPENDNTEFVNSIKYYHERAERERNNIIRIGSFNKFVSRGSTNWSTIKQELADYSLDICGFQECAAKVSEGVVTDQIGAYLQGWQFGGYAVQDTTIDKTIVSHWEVTHTDIITLLTHDGGTTSNCIHALMTIPADKWYSNAISASATLSVYCYHGSSSGKTIDGTSYTSYQVRQMEINALLAILAQDTSDFIVIVGDTNAFETGFDISTGTHHEWEMFRAAGFTPVLDGHDSTVTADLQDRYFCKADNNEVFCSACYDQIFIGSNISAEKYGVVDSNMYLTPNMLPVSDHCMVYADLKFNFDAVQQAKLREIAVSTPWW